ncbi:MAG TPA: SusC/RagA family TonB-linked outer membrane protein [Puia sp.]|nr:SusC/RagA family TonB-linked outer membrane protein [Puia sp.]
MENKHNFPPGKACLFTFFLLTTLLFSLIAFPQNGADKTRTITGTVTNAKDGTPVEGASVEAKGVTAGTLTGANGHFSISLPAAAKNLVFSFVGYASQELAIGSSAVMHVSLQPSDNSMDQVVVIGYGTQKRKDVTSAVATVKSEDFNQGGARNALDLIQGKVAGLAITRTGGSNPNSGVAVQIRGVTSLGGLSPLIVIDGIPGGNLDLLQQDDIESFDVLKDGSAAAIYGTRANGGVILVTTKKGKPGPPRFEYSTYFRKEYITRRPSFLTASQYRAKIASGLYPALTHQYDTGLYKYNTDFFDSLVNHDNLSQYHDLAMSGGSANSSYRASIYYNDFQGIGLKNSRRQYGARLNVNQKGLDGRLTSQLDIVTNFNKANLLGGGGWEDQLNRIPTLPLHNPDGTWYFQANTTNQVARLYQQFNPRNQQTTSADGKIGLEIIKGLKASIFGSVTRDSYIDNFYAQLASEPSVVSWNGGGQASKSTTLNLQYAMEPTLEYTRVIAKDHTVTAIGGYSYQYNVQESFSATNYGFPNDEEAENNLNVGTGLSAVPPPGIPRATISSAKADDKNIAFFGRINYTYKDKYMAQVILRHEGSSRFGANNKWANFPAASIGWNIAREKFMQPVRFIDVLKFRMGYGVTGNSNIANYQSLVLLGTGGFYINPDGTWRQTLGPSTNPNPDIKWERKGEFNIGIDFSVLKNRIGGAIDVYKRRTTDLLYNNYNTQLPAFIQPTITENVGTIDNEGIELTLNATPVKTRDFTWSMDATASTAKNKMVNFSNQTFKATYLEFGAIGGFGALGNAIRTVEGGDLGNFFGKRFAGFDPTGKWLFYKKDGKTKVPFSSITPDDLTVIGNGIPKYYLSWTNDFFYKNFDLRIFFRGRFGYKMLNTMDLSYGNQIYLPNNVLNSAFGKNAQLHDTYQYSDYYLEPGGFIKLDNLTLGYRVKVKTTAIHNLRIYATATNLAIFTKYKGNDPDFVNDTGLGAGVDSRGPYPSTRQFALGLNLGF